MQGVYNMKNKLKPKLKLNYTLYAVGDIVWWTDPDGGKTSQEGSIHSVDLTNRMATINEGDTGVVFSELTKVEKL